MTISAPNVGTTVTGQISLAPTYPVTAASGDAYLLLIGVHPDTSTITAPAGWTQIGSDLVGGSGAASGADTGNCRVAAYYRISDGTQTGGTSGGTITLSGSATTSGPDSRAVIIYLHSSNAGSGWAFASVANQVAASSATLNVTSTLGLTVAAADLVFAMLHFPTDTPYTAVSGLAFTQTGATYGTHATAKSGDGSTLGIDGSWLITDSYVTSGSATGTINWSGSFTTPSNAYGPVLWIRAREPQVGSTVTGDASLTATATITAQGVRGAVGDASLTATAAITAQGVRGAAATASLTATASFTATAAGQSGDASLTATAGITAAATLTATAAASLTATAGITATGSRATAGTASLTATAAIAATGVRTASSTASLTATAAIAAAAILGAVAGANSLTITAALTAAGATGAVAALTVSAGITATPGALVRTGAASLPATAAISAAGAYGARTTAALTIAAAITATGTGTLRATAALLAVATITAAGEVIAPYTPARIAVDGAGAAWLTLDGQGQRSGTEGVTVRGSSTEGTSTGSGSEGASIASGALG